MPDTVCGIAVIEPLAKFPGFYRICLALCFNDGHKEPCSLVFHESSNPPPDMKAAEELLGEPIWCFKKDSPGHGWIDYQPSIRQRISKDGPDRFHNTFNWSCQYVWLKYTACEARFNVWKILNQWGENEKGEPMPPVTSQTFELLRNDQYIL